MEPAYLICSIQSFALRQVGSFAFPCKESKFPNVPQYEREHDHMEGAGLLK